MVPASLVSQVGRVCVSGGCMSVGGGECTCLWTNILYTCSSVYLLSMTLRQVYPDTKVVCFHLHHHQMEPLLHNLVYFAFKQSNTVVSGS